MHSLARLGTEYTTVKAEGNAVDHRVRDTSSQEGIRYKLRVRM